MDYRPFPPPPDVAPWVECAWRLRGIPPHGQLILPDGRLELIFHFADRPLVEGARQPRTFVAGQSLKGLELQPTGAVQTLGLRFRPEASAALDTLVRHADRWLEQLGNAADPIATLWTLLRAQPEIAPPDAAVAYSVRQMTTHRGVGLMDSFLPPGLSSRQWQRRFQIATGFNPKSFSRILRFQNVIQLCERGTHRCWSDLALDTGFYDQAHLTNEFQAFTGQSPAAFLRGARAMPEFLLDAFFQDPPQSSAL